jgi:hypothetical protein
VNTVVKIRIFLCLFWIAGLTATGCSKDPVSPPPAPAAENTIGIEEDVVLGATGVLPASATNGTQHTFDLNGVTLVTSGAVDDFQVLYTTTSSCDVTVELFNVRSQQWDAISIANIGICNSVFTDWERLLAERDFNARDYLSNSNQLIVRAGPKPSLRALEINPRFRSIPLTPEGASARGIEIVGNVLWLTNSSKFHKYTTSGTPLADVPGGNAWQGLAWDGENFWSTNDGEVYSISPQGTQQCEFNTPGNAPSAMTWLDGRLWLASGGNLVKTNPVTSCINGVFDSEASVPSPIPDPVGLATDGTHFYVASSSQVVVMTLAGAVLNTYNFQVEAVSGIAYSNGGLWVVHQGPKGARSRGQFLSRFLLP